ncbi:MAG TPA: hypothetical protein VJG31_03105 [Candidatus Nanoarchaeia archaeon]|nr:hypothetical protein [Candidatus Nanoarchaeia archaeon]
MLRDILVLIVGLSGCLGGYILSLISPEEMESGKKYFLLLKRIFFVLIGLMFYYSYQAGQATLFVLMAVFLVLFYLNFLNKKTKEKKYLEIVNYGLFIVLFFFSAEKTLLASMVFLYGLPVGSLWRS